MKKRNHGGGVLNDPSDPFSSFQISERHAAKNTENRSLTAEQAAEIECTAEWRNKQLNVPIDAVETPTKRAAKNKAHRFLTDDEMIEIECATDFERERC